MEELYSLIKENPVFLEKFGNQDCTLYQDGGGKRNQKETNIKRRRTTYNALLGNWEELKKKYRMLFSDLAPSIPSVRKRLKLIFYLKDSFAYAPSINLEFHFAGAACSQSAA